MGQSHSIRLLRTQAIILITFVEHFEQDKLEQHDDRCALTAVSRGRKTSSKTTKQQQKNSTTFAAPTSNDKKTIHSKPKSTNIRAQGWTDKNSTVSRELVLNTIHSHLTQSIFICPKFATFCWLDFLIAGTASQYQTNLLLYAYTNKTEVYKSTSKFHSISSSNCLSNGTQLVLKNL